MNDIAPGWYKDPAEPTTQRYWDGEGWLGDPLPIDATPPSGPPSQSAASVTLPPAGARDAAPRDAAPRDAGPREAGPPTAPPVSAVPPTGAPPPGSVPPGSVPPATAWAPGAAWPPGAALPPGAAWPPGAPPPGVPLPPGPVPPHGATPHGTTPRGATPPPLPPGLPPGTIPWPHGVPVPPGYRMAYPLAPAGPRPHGLPVAPLGRRLVARLIDIGIVLALNAVATGWLVYLFLRDYLPLVRALANGASTNELPPVPDRVGVLAYLIPFVAMLVWLAYEVPAIAGSGQTIGKRALGIKVLALEAAKPIGYGRALRRWGMLGWPMIFWVCGLGFIIQLIDSLSPTWGGPLQLALHDRAARTVVVHCGRRGHEITPVNAPGKAGEL